MSKIVYESLHEPLLQGARQVAIDLNLDRFPPGRLYVRNTVDEKLVAYPCVYFTIGTEPEEEGDSSSTDDHVVYPIGVFIGDKRPPDDQAARPEWLGWRHQFMSAFRACDTIPGVEECHDVRVRSTVVLDAAVPAWFEIRSGFTVRCFTNRKRNGVQP